MAEERGPILVLLCTHIQGREALERLGEAEPGVVVKGVDGLCQHPEALREEASALGARRVVLGLCRPDYPEVEFQAHVRRAGLDPLGLQVVNLGYLQGEGTARRAQVMLRAAVARARSFPGSRPENMKLLFLSRGERVSRRALFTLPPLIYRPVPTINGDRCAARDGCDLCVGACPYGALDRAGDAILVERGRCRSCGLCLTACPWRAVEFPGWSAGELESELFALLEGISGLQPEARAVLFLCRNARVPEGKWLPVRVPCITMLPVAAILHALSVAVVALYPCDDCAMGRSQALRDLVDYCRALLTRLGDAQERVYLLDPRTPESGAVPMHQPPYPPAPASVSTVSPSPPHLYGRGAEARAVEALAARYGVGELVLEHPGSPLGVVKVNPEACTGCGACAAACPTAALDLQQGEAQVELVFDPRLCIACGRCTSVCPEEGAIAVSPVTDLARLSRGPQVFFQDQQVRCQKCSAPVATRRLLQRIAALLGSDYSPQATEHLCPDCRSTALLAQHGTQLRTEPDQPYPKG